MLFTCFWGFLITATIMSVVQADPTLYCIRHSKEIHNLDLCSISKSRPISAAALTNSNDTLYSTNKLSFDLNCKADPSTCEQVNATFKKATDMLTSVFEFETPLLINASFVDFCQEYKDCNKDNKMASIGQAYPAISYVMTDTTDNMTRMYPQPLLKQFTDLPVKPTWTKYDINAQFNTLVNWYFVNEKSPIGPNQIDFLKNVLHELIHGLGFVTSWSDDIYRAINPLFQQPNNVTPFITPVLLASTDNEQLLDGLNKPLPFWGFVEFPFDKFVHYKQNPNTLDSLSSITKQLNQFSNSNAVFGNLIDMANSWYTSDAYMQASKLYQKSVNSLNVLAVLDNEPLFWLESSVSPFSTGSSLCHVDQSSYINSKEYLMVYTANHGVGISQLNQLYPTGPIGPKLQAMMGALGYRLCLSTVKTTRPALTYWKPPPGLVGTESNPNPSITINTNGPAHSPIASPSSSSSVSTSSASIATLNISLLQFTMTCFFILFTTTL